MDAQHGPVVAILAPGAMGSALAARLTQNGVRVLTSLTGRGAATRERAEAAGMVDAADSVIASADLVLSIVPPAEAVALARRLAPSLAAAPAKPVYIDANAVGPDTLARIAEIVSATGAPFLDGAIIGLPPKPGARGPRVYVAGDDPAPALRLADHGIDMRSCPGGVGAASTLKMSYSGINKGLTALAALMVLAADRAGAGDALLAELAENEAQLLARMAARLPDMLPKAWRWAPEMLEIAAFLGADEAGRQIFAGNAALFARLAEPAGAEEAAAITRFAERAGGSGTR